MVKTLSREMRICLAIWRKAYRERNEGLDPIVINCSSLNAAISLRQAMYRAVRPYRTGEAFDEDIRQASELFVVYLEKQADPLEPHRLILKPRSTLNELEAELENLGLTEQDLVLHEERLMGGALNEFLAPESDRPANPFYERE